jgi:hypothetical protein
MTLLLIANPKKEVYKIIKILENFCNLSKMEISIEKSAIIATIKTKQNFWKRITSTRKIHLLRNHMVTIQIQLEKETIGINALKSKIKSKNNFKYHSETSFNNQIDQHNNCSNIHLWNSNHSMEQRRNPKNGYSPQRNCQKITFTP